MFRACFPYVSSADAMKLFQAVLLLLAAACSNALSARMRKTQPSMKLYGPPREVQIIPSVLPADFGNLGKDLKALEKAGVDRIQFDVMDGNFVP